MDERLSFLDYLNTGGMGSSSNGLGAIGGFSSMQTNALANPAFTSFATDKGLDLNSLKGTNLDSAIKDFNKGNESGGFMNFMGSDAFKNLTGLGQLGLGVASYFDKKEMNDQTLEGMRHNLAQSKKEAAADDAYRASYGA